MNKAVTDLAQIGLRDAPIAILIVAEDGTLAFANRGACELFGYTSEEMEDVSLAQLIPGELRHIHQNWLREFLKAPTRRRMGSGRQLHALRKDGSRFQAEIGLSPIDSDDNRLVVASIAERLHTIPADRTIGESDRWREIFEKFGDSVWDWNLDSDDVFISAPFLARIGYTPQEISTGELWHSLLHSEDVDRVERAVAAVLSGEAEVFDEEFRLSGTDGQFYWVHSRGLIVERDQQGEPKRMLGIYHDTTDRKRLETSLEVAELRWRFALESTNQGVWDWDLETDAIFFSPAWVTLFGYQPGEVDASAAMWREVAEPEDFAASGKALRAYLRGETPTYDVLVRARAKDKSERWIQSRGRIVDWDENGKPIRVIGTHQDVTEARLREQALRESDERLRGIASQVPGVIFQFELDPDRSSRFSYASDAIQNIYSVSAEDVMEDAARVFERIHPDDAEAVWNSILFSHESQSPWECDYRVIDPDGDTRWVHGSSVPSRSKLVPGRTIWHGYIHDVTQRMKRAQALEQTTRALRIANDDLEQFNYIASHDLKEPVRAIDHLVTWILEDLPDDLPDEVTKNISRLRIRTARMQSLVEDLLRYSRAGRSMTTVATVNPRDLFEVVLDDLPASAITIDYDELDATPISCSEVALETVLRNLVQNAIVHHDNPDEGKVIVRSRIDEEMLEFEVSDDGPGIPHEHHERIFRMYQRLHPDRHESGTGAGLAIVKRIISTFEGELKIESPLTDRGTRFTFTWPRLWTPMTAPGQISDTLQNPK